MTSGFELPLVDGRPPLGEVLEFMRLIWSLEHVLKKTSKGMKSAIGVTGPQRLTILLIARFPGIPAGQLAHVLHIHPSTLTGILQRLERQGFVKRRTDPQDGRRAFLGITRKGRHIGSDAGGTVEAAVERVISIMPKVKLAHARDVLIALAGAMGAEEGGSRAGGRAAPSPRPAGKMTRRRSKPARKRRASIKA